jgi:hypothetical protein
MSLLRASPVWLSLSCAAQLAPSTITKHITIKCAGQALDGSILTVQGLAIIALPVVHM